MASGLHLQLDSVFIKPLIRATVVEMLEQWKTDQAQLGDRLAYAEEEAASLLGLKRHQLRDLRLAGKIRCSQIVGRRVRYTREDLLRYLADNR